MPPTITATYAALLAIFYVAMSSYVIATRARTHIDLGPGDDPRMLVAMRRHANMAEYVPFALLMMGLAEMQGLGAAWIHGLGVLLTAGRIVHPFGVTAGKTPLPPRVAGVLATFAAILVPAVFILFTRVA